MKDRQRPKRGERLPARHGATVKDVAREAGVSIASVSRVINGSSRVADETRARVLEVVDRLKYVPRSDALNLVTRRNNLVGVILPDLHGESFSQLVRGIEKAARERDLHIMVCHERGDAREDARLISSMIGRVGGLLLMAPQVDAGLLEAHIAHDLPTVLMNMANPGTPHGTLTIDNYGGAVTAVRHLAAAGRRRIAHIAGPEGQADAGERARGYRDALAECLPDAPPLIVPGDYSLASGYTAARQLARLPARPDAVFAANDLMAIGAMQAFSDADFAIPDDVALAGFDDIPLAELFRPGLTSLRIDFADFGRRALEQLVADMSAPETAATGMQTIVPELVVRASSDVGGPPARSACA